MQEKFSEIKQKIDNLISEAFIPVLNNQIERERKFIDRLKPHLLAVEGLLTSTEAEESKLKKLMATNEQVAKLLNEHFIKKEIKSFEETFPEFSSAIEKFISESEENVEEIQDEARFVANSDDALVIRLVKPIKKFFLTVSNIPISINNFFRKTIKKPVKNKRKWKRIIRLKKLREYYFDHSLSTKLIELQRKAYTQISHSQKTLKNLYGILDARLEGVVFDPTTDKKQADLPKMSSGLDELQVRLKELEENLFLEAQKIVEDIAENYQSAYAKAGTIEFAKYRLRKGVFTRSEKHRKNLFIRTQSGWENNLSALGDALKMNNEICLIKYKNKQELNNAVANFRKTVSDKFIPYSKNIAAFVENTRDTVKVSNTMNELLKTFELVKIDIKMNLTDSLIPSISNLLIEESVGSIVADFDNKLSDHLNLVADKRILVKKDDYEHDIKDSDITFISPKELLEYSAAPKYFNSTLKLKNSLNSEIRKINNEIGELDHVSDFTIDSAVNLLKTDNSNFEESKTVAVEGLERALKKINEIENRFEVLGASFGSELGTAINQFNTEINNLTHSEKLFDLKLKLAKAKTIEKSKQFQLEVKTKAKGFFPHLLWLLRNYYREIINSYQKAREFIGLAKKSKIISNEVSNYLTETHEAIQKLPYVYQRLFEIKPLVDKRFYFSRDSEMKEIVKAFNNWQTGKFAPTVIIGEKGSGSTTLINFFVDNLPEGFKVIRSSVDLPCCETDNLLSLLGNIFGEKIFKNYEDVISHLNNTPSKQIVIIENLQRLFSRKVHGFDSLKILFEIISRTNKNVFWLTTATLYCWMYLDKTIHAPDHFGYIVNLQKLNEAQITGLVSKRHRVSGYNVEYEADTHTLKSKSYKKLQDDEKQPYLMKKYFSELNKFAQSNISLALIFWLRSAKEIIGDKILIGSPPELDYSFLENLSNDKLFALNAMLIHDGLREEDYSTMFNVPIYHARMLLLLLNDDGIIIKQNEMYIINPLLYRQIVGLLKSRNIIH